MSDPTQDSKTMTQYPTEEMIEAGVIEELVAEGRRGRHMYSSEQNDALDDEARAFYRKVIGQYRDAMRAKEQSHSQATPDEETLARLQADGALDIQAGFHNSLHRVALRAGFLLCREYMARFVEQGGDANTASSIRANWIPALGDDPGPPRLLTFDECVTAEDMEAGPWEAINPGVGPEAAVYALCVMAEAGMAIPTPPEPPASELGKAKPHD